MHMAKGNVGYDKAYSQGRIARRGDKPAKGNPYAEDTIEHPAWQAGWEQANRTSPSRE